jgi:chromosome segregation ATPase
LERTESTALNDLRTAASNPQCPNEFKVLLENWIGKRETKDQIDQELSQVRSMLSEILAEQKRLQQSIAAVNRSDAIYDRYLKKLDEIESEIEQKNERIAELYRLAGERRERKGAR